MSQAFERGIVLLQQERYDLADREFRQELSQNPDNARAHSYLALCLHARSQNNDARQEASEGIRLAADDPFTHYVLGVILAELNRPKEAEAAAREAIQLDPYDADYHGLLGHIEFSRSRWSAALDSAEMGLSINPEHAGCLNLRSMALVQLGRKEDAAQSLDDALSQHPENASIHASQGWALLHRGDHLQALEHFREALRLDPTLEYARLGIVEALKARYLIYRVMLRFFLWMGRQTQAAQWIIIIAFIFGRRMLSNLARARPDLAPWIMPIIYLSFGFLIMTWIASPLFNFLLRFNRFGRLALSDHQRRASTWIGGCFVLAIVSLAITFITNDGIAAFHTLFFGVLLFPLAMTFSRERGRPRQIATLFTILIVALTIPMLSQIYLGAASPFKDARNAANLFTYFITASLLSTWLTAILPAGSGSE
jgi:tetratricopeptide (TPR) repeat protein